MPLLEKCRQCGRELLLEEVFQGAHCRCKHCRALFQVPRHPQYAAKRLEVRPAHPPIAQARAAAVHRRAHSAPSSSFFVRHPRLASIASFRAVASFVVLGATLLGVTAWTWSGPSGLRRTNPLAVLNRTAVATGQSSGLVEDDRYTALLNSDPTKTFFGVPIRGNTIGYVVDCDTTMMPYYRELASITGVLNEALGQSSRRFGIVEALAKDRGRSVEKVSEPSSDLKGARSVLDSTPTGGETDLPEALAMTEAWYADEIFLVLSKKIDADEISLLTQHAEQSGAVTHVIAFGEAARQDLSQISDATGGRFVSVNSQILSALASPRPRGPRFSR